jgi:peroxiredoxin
MTANVCPKCGKRDFLTKSLKDIRMESALKQQSTESLTTETEYICPICSEKMVLIPGGTLKCQSRSCGYLIALKEFLSNYGKEKATTTPPEDTFGFDVKPPREKISPKFFEVAKSKVQQKIDTDASVERQDFTTSIETKAEDQYFWKSDKLGKRKVSSDKGIKDSSKRWESTSKDIKIEFPWRKIGVAARFIGLIAAVGLVGFGIFYGVRALINSDIFDNITITTPSITTTELIISAVEYDEIDHANAIISWETNIPAVSHVEYGISDALGYSTDPSVELTTSHSILINGLEPETTYYFSAISMSENEDHIISSPVDSFTTLMPPDSEPPLITGVYPSDVSDINATITWKTDEEATGKIEYGTSEDDYTISTDINTEMKTEHIFILEGLSPSTTYHFIIKSEDISNNEAISENYSFTTSPWVREGVDVGERAIDFTLPVLDGGSVTLSQHRGQLVLVNFWFLGCGGCLKELPYIDEIHRTWTGNKELTVLTIDIRDYETRLRTFMEKNEYTFPVLLDTDDTKIWEEYGVTIAPKTFFIDTNGIVRKTQRGAFNNTAEIQEILDSL